MFFAPLPDLPDRPEVVRMHFTHRPCPFGPTPRTSSRLGDLNLLGQELAVAVRSRIAAHLPGPVREVYAVNQIELTATVFGRLPATAFACGQGFGPGGRVITVPVTAAKMRSATP